MKIKNMMRLILLGFFALVISQFAFGQSKEMPVKNAQMTWRGEKIVGGHEGTISLAKGTLIVNNGKVKGGKFTVDMTSIKTTDIEEAEGKQRLDAHLKSKDFFDVAKYPQSTLEFTRITDKGNGNYQIAGNLTIKGITKSINFPLYALNGKANATLIVDRTKFGIKYGSSNFFTGLGDYAISDDFKIQIKFNY